MSSSAEWTTTTWPPELDVCSNAEVPLVLPVAFLPASAKITSWTIQDPRHEKKLPPVSTKTTKTQFIKAYLARILQKYVVYVLN